MRIFRGLPRSTFTKATALSIGNFDGVHLGHQAMLHELKAQADARGLPTCVMTFSPHPKEYFATALATQMHTVGAQTPRRISTLRDKVTAIEACGIDAVIVLPFNQRLASMSAASFVSDVLSDALRTKYLLIGDDFCFGAKRAGNFSMLQSTLPQYGCDLQAMHAVEQGGIRVSSSAVRQALSNGRMQDVAALLGRTYTISGHVIHGAKLGRELGFPTLNVAFKHDHPAAQGIFVVRVHGLDACPIQGVANLGTRPALDANDINGGRVLLETYCLQWPEQLGADGGYGKIVRIELLHKLHDELAYDGLESLKTGIANDIVLAKAYFDQVSI